MPSPFFWNHFGGLIASVPLALSSATTPLRLRSAHGKNNEKGKAASLVLGFLAAPLVPLAAATMVFPRQAYISDALSNMLTAGFYLVVGVPVFVLLRRRGILNTLSMSLSGLVIGALAALLFRWPHQSATYDILVMAPTGFVSAMVFWVIWRMGTWEAA